MPSKTARLTILIEPARKQAFEKLCHAQDCTPSQVVRRLVREFIDQNSQRPRAAASRRRAKSAPHPR